MIVPASLRVSLAATFCVVNLVVLYFIVPSGGVLCIQFTVTVLDAMFPAVSCTLKVKLPLSVNV